MTELFRWGHWQREAFRWLVLFLAILSAFVMPPLIVLGGVGG